MLLHFTSIYFSSIFQMLVDVWSLKWGSTRRVGTQHVWHPAATELVKRCSHRQWINSLSVLTHTENYDVITWSVSSSAFTPLQTIKGISGDVLHNAHLCALINLISVETHGLIAALIHSLLQEHGQRAASAADQEHSVGKTFWFFWAARLNWCK